MSMFYLDFMKTNNVAPKIDLSNEFVKLMSRKLTNPKIAPDAPTAGD